MDVALIQWPFEEAKRLELEGRHQPRLLLVEPGVEPPVCIDALEDWVRLPASTVDTKARVRGLMARAEETLQHLPRLVGGGILQYRSNRAQLTPLQYRLIGALASRFDAVVSRDELVQVAWEDDRPDTNTVDVTMGRLRRAVGPLGLQIRTVRSRGYLLTSETA